MMMPIKFGWYVKDRILLSEHIGVMTAQELHTELYRFSEYLNAATHRIHLIADWQQAENYPMQFNMIPSVLPILSHRNRGKIAVVRANAYATLWMRTFMKLVGTQYIVFNTIEEAGRFLEMLNSSSV